MERDILLTKLRSKLIKAQEQMKAWANKSKREIEFKEGDWVYVKLRPYHQRSLTRMTKQKLGKWYFGPFQVTERIGPLAYRLELLAHSHIHPVFHCSLLKKHHGDPPGSTAKLPQATRGTH